MTRFHNAIILPFLLLNLCASSGTVPTFADSLRKLLPAAENVPRIIILNQLASIYAPVNFDSSIMYSAQAMRIATQYGEEYGIGLARFHTGNAYYYNTDMKNALLSYLSALKVLEKYDLPDLLGDLNVQLGNVNFFIRRPEKAMPYYRKAFEYYRAAGNEPSLYGAYHAMSMTFFWNELSVDSALFYAKKCLDNAKRRANRLHEAYAQTIIGLIYLHAASLPEKQNVLLYCDSAIKIAVEIEDDFQLSINYIDLGGYYDHTTPFCEITADLALARSYYTKALEVSQNARLSLNAAISLDYLAEIDIEEGKYQQAETHLKLSEKLLQEYSHSQFSSFAGDVLYPFLKVHDYILSMREKVFLYDARFRLAKAKGEFPVAIEYQRLYYQSLDSLQAEQQSKQLELLMAEAEAEKTDQKFRMLSQESELSGLKLSRTRAYFIGGAGAVIVLSLFGLLFFQRKRYNAEQKSIVMEQRLLRAQMNPHFLFNSLASIQNYIINQDTDQASIYLSRFSRLVRNILDNSTEEYVPLEKEIETITNYLELQKARYAGKFDFTISVDSTIDEENMMIPPMLAQPFIENSIEHGIRHKETNGHIDIRFQLEDSLIRFEVEDDGVGRERAQEIEKKIGPRHRSMATSITTDRLATINKKLKKKIRMEIIDLKDNAGNGCGTKVRFGIPNRIV